MQTNAILVDEDWITIFQTFSVNVGFSIDGPEIVHDKYRVDRNGHPTHEKTVSGIRRLVAASNDGRIMPPGALIVIQPETDAQEVFLFVASLGVKNMDFLLPDATWENPPNNRSIGTYLCDLFDSWLTRDDPRLNVRILKSTMSLFLGGQSYLGGFGPVNSTALTVLSNGEINGDDFLRPCGDEVIDLGMHLSTSSLADGFAKNSGRLSLLRATILPGDCSGCAFENVCFGGQLTHRYSKANAFDNRSVYCEGLKLFYEHVLLFLHTSGVALKDLESVLRKPPLRELCVSP